MIRRIAIVIGVLVLLTVGFFGSIMVASESGEVVVLRTFDAAGTPEETRLWVVDHEGSAWLRAGSAESAWFVRLVAHPEVEVERDGAWQPFRAVPERERTPTIDALMGEKYGLPDRLIAALMRDESASVAIRLTPRPAG